MEHRNVVLRLVSLIFIFSYLVYFLNSIRLVIASTDTTTFSGFTNETDRRALIAIKDLIPGDPFSVFSSWNNSLHFCYWQGITCSLRHQRVTMLNLPSLSLAGSLSPHIGNLTFLQTIHLEDNSFHGTIPQELGRLFRLQNLFLANNSFQGEFPINLTHCSSIQVIDLSRNDLVGTLPNELSSLSSLLGLRLFRNSFTGTVPRSFGNFSTLRVLFLSENYLQGTIPFELGWLSNLELINLSSNNLSEYGMAREVSTQGDVYSYGILLLEIFTGKSPTNNMFADGLSLHNYANKINISSKIKECLISIFRIGVACSAELPRERMDIKDALVELHVIRNAFLER